MVTYNVDAANAVPYWDRINTHNRFNLQCFDDTYREERHKFRFILIDSLLKMPTIGRTERRQSFNSWSIAFRLLIKISFQTELEAASSFNKIFADFKSRCKIPLAWRYSIPWNKNRGKILQVTERREKKSKWQVLWKLQSYRQLWTRRRLCQKKEIIKKIWNLWAA
jgi:hypothetical protein